MPLYTLHDASSVAGIRARNFKSFANINVPLCHVFSMPGSCKGRKKLVNFVKCIEYEEGLILLNLNSLPF